MTSWETGSEEGGVDEMVQQYKWSAEMRAEYIYPAVEQCDEKILVESFKQAEQ